MSEKIDLGNSEKLPNGKVRWQKNHKKNKWKSLTYDQDSRRNRQDAWESFKKFRDEINKKEASKQAIKDNDHPLRKEIVEALQDEISLAQMNQDSKQEQWASTALKTVRETDQSNLKEVKELLGLDNSFEQQAAINVVKSIVSKQRKKEIKTDELVEEWLKFRKIDHKAKNLSAGAFVNIRRQVKKFALFCPNILDANALKFANYKASVLLSDMSKSAQRDDLTTAKTFLEWCSDTAEVIEPIKGLRKRGSGIKISKKKEIKIWKDEDVFDLLKTVKAEQKLYCLLILNTGAYESDIGSWKHDCFNKANRTLTFKRHKEEDTDEVPTVTYKLWDETYKLLVEHQSNHETLLLTSSVNTVLWKRELVGDDYKTKSIIGKNYRSLRLRLSKNWGTLKNLRKTAASKLSEHDSYARYSQYFLGHAPSDTIDTFYVKPNQAKFDEAVLWLRSQFIK
ncbi:MAG: hypothetical protein R3C17_10685 [Planctomycetaceae bacterium]